MQTLDRRLTALERMGAKQHFDMIIHFIDAAEPNAEIAFLTDREGGEWTRNVDESERDFKARAIACVKRNEVGAALLFGCH